jgi:TonB family protein
MAYRNSDIERYLRGELTPAEMHALEQKALRDPFLAEALEGAEHAGHEHFSFDIEFLQRSIHEKARKKRPRTITLNGWPLYLGIAASLLILAVSSFVVLTMIKQRRIHEAGQISALDTTTANKNLAGIIDSTSTGNLAMENSEKDEKPPARQSRPVQPANEPTASADLESRDEEPVTTTRAAEDEAVHISKNDVAQGPASDTVRVTDSRASTRAESATTTGELRSTRDARVFLALDKSVKGKVVSAEDGTSLAGVNVLIKGTNKGTITDTEGYFSIDMPSGNDSLVFSFIGLTSKELKVNEGREVNVEMASDISQLSEMVVTGYGDTDADRGTPLIEMAEPQGGRNAFKKYLEEQLQYPKQALDNQVRGKVTVQFTVQPNGQLSDFQVLKGLGYGCDEEVIRLIKEGPSWIPSKKDNQPVKEKVKIRLNFNLPEKK